MTAEQREAKKRAGQLGGLATFQKYGRQHFVKLGKLGARSLYAKYSLIPCDLANWCLIDKTTGKVKAVW